MEKYKFKYKGKEYELVEGEHKLKNHCAPCCFKDTECTRIKEADCIRGKVAFKYYFKEVEHKEKKLNLNHIQEFTDFTKGYNELEQIEKIAEEFEEVCVEVFAEPNHNDVTRSKDELLDLITASYNMAFMLGLTQDDIEVHKKKLEGYKNSGKY